MEYQFWVFLKWKNENWLAYTISQVCCTWSKPVFIPPFQQMQKIPLNLVTFRKKILILILHNRSHDNVAQKNDGAINILGVLGSFRLKSLKWFNEAKNRKRDLLHLTFWPVIMHLSVKIPKKKLPVLHIWKWHSTLNFLTFCLNYLISMIFPVKGISWPFSN